MMKLEQLRYIVEVSNTGSITIAAKNLHMSQPNLSQSIVNLEKELNVNLFKRSRMGTFPTSSGEKIIEQAKQVLIYVEEISDTVQLHQSNLTSTLSLAVIPNISLTILPKTLSIFNQNYPGVSFDIIETGSIQCIQSVLDDDADFGLISVSNNDKLDSTTLKFEPLFTNKPIAYVNSDSPLAKKSNVSFKELVKYPVALFNETYTSTDYLLTMLKQHGEPNVLFSSENSETIKKVISNTAVVGFFGTVTLKTDPYILSNQVVPLNIIEFENHYSYHGIVTKVDKRLSVAAKKFIEELRIQAIAFKNLYNLPDYSKKH